MNKLAIFFAFILFFQNFCGQTFKPIDTAWQSSYKRQKVSFFELEKEKKISALKKEFSGDKKREYVKIYQNIFDDYIKDAKNKKFINYPKFSEYVNSIIAEIANRNKDYNLNDLKFIISRDLEPNFHSDYGGLLVFNYNFLNYLDSEDEFASVICHELSHQILDHIKKSIDFQVKKLINDSIKAEEYRIKNLEYNKSSESQKFLKNWVYEKQRLKREHEIEADSLGFVLYKNTKYKQSSYYNMLKKLDNIDIEKDTLNRDDYKKIFPIEKFKEDWFETEEAPKYYYSKEHYFKWNIDSLKTHPSISERLAKFKNVQFTDNNENFSVNGKLFSTLKSEAEEEIIYSAFYEKKYGISLYKSLKMYKKNPENIFIKDMIYKNLEMLESEKREKRYGQYIIPANNFDQSKSEQLFYTFFDNLTLNDLINFKNLFQKQ